jgi:hypothetical protein
MLCATLTEAKEKKQIKRKGKGKGPKKEHIDSLKKVRKTKVF